MEIKRKKITQAEIFKNEQKFVTDITEICQYKNADFHAIGYELVLEFGQKDSEYQKQFDALSDDTEKKYESGYVSRAIITVKRQKTEAEKQDRKAQFRSVFANPQSTLKRYRMVKRNRPKR